MQIKNEIENKKKFLINNTLIIYYLVQKLNSINSEFTSRYYHEVKHSVYVNVNSERIRFEQTGFFPIQPRKVNHK